MNILQKRFFQLLLESKVFVTIHVILILLGSTYLYIHLNKPSDLKKHVLHTDITNIKKISIVQQVYAAIDITKYSKPPYNLPAPNGAATLSYSEEAINNANTLGNAIADIQPYLLKKYDATHVDPFLAVMWTMAIEGSGANPYFWNCNETLKGKENISKGCRGWYNSGNWQVGYGIQVAQAGSHLVEDFMEIYKSADANMAQEVGNKVIKAAGITNPSTFPAKSVQQLVSEAGTPGTIYVERPTTDAEAAAQQAIAILLMDQKIGAAAIAQEVANDIGTDWAGRMRSWNQEYYTNGLNPSNPIFSNNIQELAKVYTGKAGSSGPGLSSGSYSMKLIVKPKVNDIYVINEAKAQIYGGGTNNSSSTSTPTSSPSATGSPTP